MHAHLPLNDSEVDVFRAMLFLNEDIGELAVVAGEDAILMERVGVAAMVVLRLDTGVGLPLELKLCWIGLARSSEEELKSSLVGVEGNVGDSGSAKPL